MRALLALVRRIADLCSEVLHHGHPVPEVGEGLREVVYEDRNIRRARLRAERQLILVKGVRHHG